MRRVLEAPWRQAAARHARKIPDQTRRSGHSRGRARRWASAAGAGIGYAVLHPLQALQPRPALHSTPHAAALDLDDAVLRLFVSTGLGDGGAGADEFGRS